MGKGKTTTTATSAPWTPQTPYLLKSFGEADKLYNQPLKYYGGNTLAGFTPEQSQAQNMVASRAMSGSDLTRGGSDVMNRTIRGDYLNPESNPNLQYTIGRAFESALPQMDTSAVSAGRYGSGAWGQMKGRTMGDIAGNIYGQNYQAERDRQMQAVGAAPAYASNDYADMAKLSAVGEERQAMEQAQINEAMKKFEFEQMEPWDRLGMYSDLIEGQYGGTSTGFARSNPWKK